MPGQLSPGPVPGDTIEINAICTEDVTVTTPGLTIGNDTSSNSLNTSDGVQGQLEIAGASNTLINGILIGNASTPFAFAGAGELANLFIHDSGAVQLKNSQVSNGPLIGILALRSSAVSVLASTVSSNGIGNADSNTNMGILAASNSTVYLGKNDGTNAATVMSNVGAGVAITDASSLSVFAANINGNGLDQVFLQGASSGLVTGAASQIVAPSSGCCQAIFAGGGSTLDIEQAAVVTGNQAHAAIALDASTLLLQGSIVTSGAGASQPANSEATITASGNAVVALAGGNNVCFGTVGIGVPCNINDLGGGNAGFAINIAHVSTLLQVNAGLLGFTQAQDAIGGGGSVQLQSTVDLGLGLLAGSTPSLAWTSGSANIAVAQNSSFRLDGGTLITGKLSVGQGSNAFFNKSAGGTNTITAGVACNFATVPAAHLVASATTITPTPSLATSMSSAAKGQCLPF